MKKRVLAVIIAVCFIFCSCNGGNQPPATSSTTAATVTDTSGTTGASPTTEPAETTTAVTTNGTTESSSPTDTFETDGVAGSSSPTDTSEADGTAGSSENSGTTESSSPTVSTAVTTVATTVATTAAPVAFTPSKAVIVTAKTGSLQHKSDKYVIDYSYTADGYITVQYLGDRPRINLDIYVPNGTLYRYQYDGDKNVRAFPLSEGNGTYKIDMFEGAGTTYSPLASVEISASVSNTLAPFLMVNHLVTYSANSTAIKKGEELCSTQMTDVQKVEAVYSWIVENVAYDEVKAQNITSGAITSYLPVVDNLIRDKKGICFDYSAAAAAILRSQGIPTRLVRGYAGGVYHAWIDVYTKDNGWVNGYIRFDGNKWVLMDPTFAAANKENSGFQNFVGNGSNYTKQHWD
ncbi:MAG: transglutaminase-like domain-containing protein [Oscillospiraceae bacterium]|nr:transglutaminase-like domain-containing protein [Oscillospiraceae bacterium]